MIHFLGKATLTFLAVVALCHPVRSTPNLLQESHAEQQVRQQEQQRSQLVELGRELSPAREQRRASDLEEIVGRIVGFCDSFYGCGAGVRFMDW